MAGNGSSVYLPPMAVSRATESLPQERRAAPRSCLWTVPTTDLQLMGPNEKAAGRADCLSDCFLPYEAAPARGETGKKHRLRLRGGTVRCHRPLMYRDAQYKKITFQSSFNAVKRQQGGGGVKGHWTGPPQQQDGTALCGAGCRPKGCRRSHGAELLPPKTPSLGEQHLACTWHHEAQYEDSQYGD